MEGAGLKNHALVEQFPDKLTHKTVQKARRGTRQISAKAKWQIVEALNKILAPEEPFSPESVFPKSAEAAKENAGQITSEPTIEPFS